MKNPIGRIYRRQPKFDDRAGVLASGWDVRDVSESQNKGLVQLDMANLSMINNAPASLGTAERLMLFTLVFALQPRTYVEVGTWQGGSALIVLAAMKASGISGRIALIDPNPQISDEHWAILEEYTTLVQDFSPGAIAQAHSELGRTIDFAFIDGDHSYEAVIKDIEATIPVMSRPGHILFHDGYNAPVSAAIRRSTRKRQAALIDCGMITRDYTHYDNDSELWSGFHLVRVRA